MRAGYAFADITPTQAGITLSGFAARRNNPSEGIADPLSVHALAIEESGERVLLLVFDLLGLGPEITSEIHDALDRVHGLDTPPNKRILCCTHTHSAPSTVKLIGCGIEDRDYWNQVVSAAAEAARSALESMRSAKLRYEVVTVEGESYNRHKVLEDGRVVMTQHPDEPVRKEGPIWDRFLLVRIEDESGNGIAGIAHWAAHACTVGEMLVSADYPGRLRDLLAERYAMPFVYLQGACANINPPLGDMTRGQMLRNAESVAKRVSDVTWPEPVEPVPFGLVNTTLRLAYGPVPSKNELSTISSGMSAIAETGNGPPEAVALLANILNVKPGEEPHPGTMRYIATLVREWAETLRLAQSDDARAAADGCDLAISAWRLGPLVFCFVAGEVFAETAIAVQEAFPGLVVNVVGYASPLVGYIPTDDALDEGGYEARHAYVFYGHPAAFAKGSEPRLLDALKGLIAR